MMKINNIELSIVEKYIPMLLYAHEGKCKGKLWFQKEMFMLIEVFKELKRLILSLLVMDHTAKHWKNI